MLGSAFLITVALLATDIPPRQTVVVVVGAEGTPEYGTQFREWAERWKKSAERSDSEFSLIGLDPPGERSDHELLHDLLNREDTRSGSEPLWLVLIGHGTFDGKTARFNLRGPDLTPAELGRWLQESTRPTAIINCASCSSPFLNELSRPDRVIVTATKSGYEHNLTRFGEYLSQAMLDPRADLDKDDQVSLLEAWILAAAGVREFYAREGRLETEHPLLDDNGDRLGTPPDWFQGTRAVKVARDGAAPDGLRAAQFCLIRSQQERQLSPELRVRRDRLELELSRLRQRKAQLPEEDYLNLLEPLLLELAELYEAPATDAASRESNSPQQDESR